MQAVGNFLERLGPTFAVVFFVLLITLSVALVVISTARLVQREPVEKHA